jgi:hypothetical protein
MPGGAEELNGRKRTTQEPLEAYHRNRFGRAYAFTLADVQCLSSNHAPVSIAQAASAPTLVNQIKQIRRAEKQRQW